MGIISRGGLWLFCIVVYLDLFSRLSHTRRNNNNRRGEVERGREVIEWMNEQVSCQNAAYLPSSSALATQLVYLTMVREFMNDKMYLSRCTQPLASCMQLGCTTNWAQAG